MAKKGQVVQFQTELNNEEEFHKYITEKEGLILIDVYSEFAGPCVSMTPNLKKLKLDLGTENFHVAMANADAIPLLERFRNKSEPTWLFVSQGKMKNITYGANAPRLMKIITEEIKAEEEAMKGERERELHEFDEIIGEEWERWEVEQAKLEEKEAAEKARKEKELLEWRTAQAENCLERFPEYGIVMTFPHVRVDAKPVLLEQFQLHGLVVFKEETLQLTEEVLEDMLFFSDTQFEEHEVDLLLKEKVGSFLLKPAAGTTLEDHIDNIVRLIVYGESMQPPGDEDCLARQFYRPLPQPEKTKETDELAAMSEMFFNQPSQQAIAGAEEEAEEEQEEEEERWSDVPYTGIWTPMNLYTRAFCIKHLFSKIHAPIALPEPVPTPPHYLVVFDALKKAEVMKLMETYPDAVIRYGFFYGDDPYTAQLITKNYHNFEHMLSKKGPTYKERIHIQLSRKGSEAVLAFADLGPIRISNNIEVGEEECKVVFPEGYDESEPEIEEEEVVKPKRKMRRKRAAPVEGAEEEEEEEFEDYDDDDEEEHEEEEEEEEEVVEPVVATEEDKATSPMPEGEGAAPA